MQAALRDEFGWDTTESAHSMPRRNKFLAAGAAVVGAGAMAVTPVTVTPTLPDIQVRAVELSAVVDPFTQFGNSIEATLANLELLGTNLSTVTLPALGQILQSSPELATELLETFASTAADPTGTLTALKGVVDQYGPIIGSGSAASNTALQTALENLPTILQNTVNYLQNGEFVEAFSEVNIWFLVQFLERPFVPLIPTLGIPGDIADALGAEKAGDVLDALFTRGGINGITKAVLAPALTAVLQSAVILDEVRAAYEDGDTATALTGLASLPVYVTNAFFNGFVPPFPTRSTFPGVFSDGGPVDYFAVDLPRIIGNALKPATPALAKVASTEVAPAGETVTLDIGADAKTPAAGAEGTDKAVAIEAGAPAVEPETEVVAPVTEDTAVAPVTEETPAKTTTARPDALKEFGDGVAKAVNDTRITLKKTFGGAGKTQKKESTDEKESTASTPAKDDKDSAPAKSESNSGTDSKPAAQ
ncbi:MULTISPECIES: hypothetical protein [Mycolicibacterium]|uniref:hypothetical protein n=1 Tax=Mycolicibacterium monacense TaxID=85693 RepID=UPI0007EB4313|nr:hypothetical protein [Mycolicibacterium monacense]OBB75813.1 hypothetical protein A6B34_13205 [Mycolicibacterium monacense]